MIRAPASQGMAQKEQGLVRSTHSLYLVRTARIRAKVRGLTKPPHRVFVHIYEPNSRNLVVPLSITALQQQHERAQGQSRQAHHAVWRAEPGDSTGSGSQARSAAPWSLIGRRWIREGVLGRGSSGWVLESAQMHQQTPTKDDKESRQALCGNQVTPSHGPREYRQV